MRRKTFFLATLFGTIVTASLAACGKEGEGLDRRVDYSDAERFGESCGQALLEMRTANPDEFAALDRSGMAVFDTSQPEGRLAFQSAGTQICQSLLGSTYMSNEKLSSFRELYIQELKKAIGETRNTNEIAGYQEALRVLEKSR